MNTSVHKTFPNRQEIQKMQDKYLCELMGYLELHSPYYQRIFKENNIRADKIRRKEDLLTLPTTGKEDLQMFNQEFLCVPNHSVVEYTSTSGTLGSPVTIALTESDLKRLALNEWGSFTCAGCTPEDRFQLMLTLDRQFMAGMAYYSGIRMLGAGIIRVGPGVPSMQWETIFQSETHGFSRGAILYLETDSVCPGAWD